VVTTRFSSENVTHAVTESVAYGSSRASHSFSFSCAGVLPRTIHIHILVYHKHTHDLRYRDLVDRADDGVEVTGASALVVAPIWLNAAVLFVDQYVHHTSVCLLADHVSDHVSYHVLILFVC
jgi:hypothetical protein